MAKLTNISFPQYMAVLFILIGAAIVFTSDEAGTLLMLAVGVASIVGIAALIAPKGTFEEFDEFSDILDAPEEE